VQTFLALLTGGGLAAAGGLISGLLTNWLGGKRDDRKYSHEQDMAREARRQERLEGTYGQLITYLSRYRDIANSIRPLWGPVQPPKPMPLEETWALEASISANASEEVRQLLAEWRVWIDKIGNADTMLRVVEESRNPGDQVDAQAMRELKALPTYKENLVAADAAIRDQIRRELGTVPLLPSIELRE
jgi:hypothetical protein